MDIGIAEVRKSIKKTLGGGDESNIDGAELSMGEGGGGARATPKV